ncbi:hypothetical protein Bca52824_076745 [Brassica carinata]|uniref:Dof-type domain-containing protein n=1 Tax=Brassica carinata TaxID=52824 RepID=A0A8X7TZC6_BRACI|nr:hypothetical protein Bca52824_076745 [Brassica carinata]
MNNQSATDNSEQDDTTLQMSSDLNKESKETSENNYDKHSEITTTTTTSEEKTTELKKPDKILPCPRCNSADTKFCYYNNYNVSQPRHFCRNCQRYWTSGGSMRTVPVGSGRRKNKGWVSTDLIDINSKNNSNDYNSSSTKILSFESLDSWVSEKGQHRSSDSKMTADSVSQDFNKFQGFLPAQVTSSVSPPWPYHQYPLNPSFYHIPVCWGYTVPEKGQEAKLHTKMLESKDTSVRARLNSPSESINDEVSVATREDRAIQHFSLMDLQQRATTGRACNVKHILK